MVKKTLRVIAFFGGILFPCFGLGQLSVMETAEDFFAKGQYEQAQLQYEAILKSSASSPSDQSLSQCRVGVILSIQQKVETSKEFLEKSLNNTSLPTKHSSLCQYALLQIYVMTKAYPQAKILLQKMDQLNLRPIYIARTWALAAETGRGLRDKPFELQATHKLQAVMETNNIAEVELKILGNKKILLSELKRTGNGPRLPITPSPPNTELTLSHIHGVGTSSSVPAGLPTGVLGIASNDNATKDISPITLWKSQIDHYKELVQAEDPRTIRLGIVLPQGAFYTRFNSRILRGLSAFLASTATQGVNVSVIVRSSPADPGGAEIAAKQLILNDRVHAIIGTVSQAQTLAILQVATPFYIPVFAVGPVIFSEELDSLSLVRLGIFGTSQCEVTVLRASEDKISVLGILAPNDPYGHSIARQCSSLAKEKGITTYETFYKMGTLDLHESASELLKHRDLQAIFIPDTLAKAKLAASTVAYIGIEEMKYYGEKQWYEGANGKTSLADPFINETVLPHSIPGSFYSFLMKHLKNTNAVVDIERATFDAAIMFRQAHFFTAGKHGIGILQAMRSSQFRADGTMQLGGVQKNHEPLVKFSLAKFKNGKISTK